MPRTKKSAIDTALGARIRLLRRANNLNQAQLGAALGVSYQQVQKYEMGRDQVSVSLLLEMARVFGVGPDSLLGGLGRKRRPATNTQKQAEELFLYAATRQGLSVLRAFAAIENPTVRHSLAALVDTTSRSAIAEGA